MLPFGQAVMAWRLERGLTQNDLARQARLSRPNLSAIERGAREVTLKTVRSLASALGIKPGILADGEGPSIHVDGSRESLERIADAVVRGKRLEDAHEMALAVHVGNLVRSQLQAHGIAVPHARRIGRSGVHAWLRTAHFPPNVIRSLLKRVREKATMTQEALPR
jgi:transcriptional regulator with XRE-family HTH domain